MNTVLLLGGTGRTGRRVMQQLLDRGWAVRAIVRSISKLPPGVIASPNLTVVEASVVSLTDAELDRHLAGCNAVVSCLGHVISFEGIFGQPRDLVTRVMTRVCRRIEAAAPAAPVKVILMSSVSVQRARGLDTRRGSFERAFVGMLRGLVPPAKDNQTAADFLVQQIGPKNAFVEWVVVRPDSLLEGEVSKYDLHEGLTHSVFAPGKTNMANVAHFMGELLARPEIWAQWKGKLPVITNASASAAARTRRASTRPSGESGAALAQRSEAC